MRLELAKLVGRRRRNKLGQFVKGRGNDRFVLTQNQHQFDQDLIAEQWEEFFGGKTKNVFLRHELLRYIPLSCDFVNRPGENQKEPWLINDLMNLPARPVTPLRRGIKLKKLVA